MLLYLSIYTYVYIQIFKRFLTCKYFLSFFLDLLTQIILILRQISVNCSLLLLGSGIRRFSWNLILADHRRFWKTAAIKSSHLTFNWECWNVCGFQASPTNQQFNKFDKFLCCSLEQFEFWCLGRCFYLLEWLVVKLFLGENILNYCVLT